MLTLRSTDTAATTKTEDPDKARKALEGYRLLAGFVFTISLLTLIEATKTSTELPHSPVQGC
jgi:hypothetical protein